MTYETVLDTQQADMRIIFIFTWLEGSKWGNALSQFREDGIKAIQKKKKSIVFTSVSRSVFAWLLALHNMICNVGVANIFQQQIRSMCTEYCCWAFGALLKAKLWFNIILQY